MNSALTFTTETDNDGAPLSYLLTGNVTDWDGAVVPVGEFTFNFDKAWKTLSFYTREFQDVTVNFQTKEQA